jgi:hypothetical protein
MCGSDMCQLVCVLHVGSFLCCTLWWEEGERGLDGMQAPVRHMANPRDCWNVNEPGHVCSMHVVKQLPGAGLLSDCLANPLVRMGL